MQIQRCASILRAVADILAETEPAADADLLACFLHERCYPAPGRVTRFKAFRDAFAEFAIERGKRPWRWQRIVAELPPQYPYGIVRDNMRAIGNISLHPVAPDTGPVTRNGRRLRMPNAPY